SVIVPSLISKWRPWNSNQPCRRRTWPVTCGGSPGASASASSPPSAMLASLRRTGASWAMRLVTGRAIGAGGHGGGSCGAGAGGGAGARVRLLHVEHGAVGRDAGAQLLVRQAGVDELERPALEREPADGTRRSTRSRDPQVDGDEPRGAADHVRREGAERRQIEPVGAQLEFERCRAEVPPRPRPGEVE